MNDNPFMVAQPKANPFMDQSLEQVAEQRANEIVAREDGRKRRPDGSLYSSDPRERMKQLQEDNKVGPQFGKLGGRRAKRNERALDVIAESAAEDAEHIRDVFRDGIDPSNPMGVRLQAAEKYLKAEADKLDRDERAAQQEFDNMSKEALVGSIVGMIEHLRRANQIAREVEDDSGMIIDGQSWEVEDGDSNAA